MPEQAKNSPETLYWRTLILLLNRRLIKMQWF